jgi:hypothetical protein
MISGMDFFYSCNFWNCICNLIGCKTWNTFLQLIFPSMAWEMEYNTASEKNYLRSASNAVRFNRLRHISRSSLSLSALLYYLFHSTPLCANYTNFLPFCFCCALQREREPERFIRLMKKSPAFFSRAPPDSASTPTWVIKHVFIYFQFSDSWKVSIKSRSRVPSARVKKGVSRGAN